jgi:hypothetical protein
MYVVIDWARTGQEYAGNRYVALDKNTLQPEERKAVVGQSHYYAEAKSKADKLNKRRSNPGTITREGDTRRSFMRRTPRGGRTRVKRTMVSKTKNKGKKGKTPKSRRWAKIKPGELPGWKKSYSQKKRLAALVRLVGSVGYATVIRRLNQIANVSTDYETAKRMRSDMLALKKKYRPDAYKADKSEFEKKTKAMLRGKKKVTKKKKTTKKKATKRKKATKKKVAKKKKGTKKRRANPKKMGSGNVQINLAKSAFKNIGTLSTAIQKKTGWPMTHCRQIARRYAKKV